MTKMEQLVESMRALLNSTRDGNPQDLMYTKAASRGLDPTTAAEFAAGEGHLLETGEALLRIAEDPRLAEDLLVHLNQVFLMVLAARANNLVFIDRVGPAVDKSEKARGGRLT
jgi:hypothetical protein